MIGNSPMKHTFSVVTLTTLYTGGKNMEYGKIMHTLECDTLTPEKLLEAILKMVRESYFLVKKAIEAIPDKEIENFLNEAFLISRIRVNFFERNVYFEDCFTKEHIFSFTPTEKDFFEGNAFIKIEVLPLRKAIEICYEDLEFSDSYIREMFENLDFKAYFGKYFIGENLATSDIIVSEEFFAN